MKLIDHNMNKTEKFRKKYCVKVVNIEKQNFVSNKETSQVTFCDMSVFGNLKEKEKD